MPRLRTWLIGFASAGVALAAVATDGAAKTVAQAVTLAVVMGIPVVAFVDALRQPAAAWDRMEQPRRFWVPLLLVAMLLPVVGLAAAVPYLRMVESPWLP